MASITQLGMLNTTALVVPGLYVQIVPPQNLVLNGVPSNVIGVVGTAQWGPVNKATVVGTMQDYARAFGAVQARKYDMGTQVATAVLQGAQAFRCVRVTDGTDAAAQAVLAGTSGAGVVLTALYTGTLGNSLVATIGKGSAVGTSAVSIGLPGQVPEVYNNISGTGAALWTNLVTAINTGSGPLRGPSQLVVAAQVGTYAAAPVNGSVTFSGGTDGATTITAATLVGVSTTPRKGMYALMNQGCSIGLLADADDPTQWTVQDAFGISQAIYMMLVAPAGSVISNGTNGTVDLLQQAGLNDWASKLLHGDWLYWNDQVNQQIRLVSPQGFAAGYYSNSSPQNSGLNKPLYGIIGSQTSGIVGSPSQQSYSSAELAVLIQAGIDVIANPSPGGNYWALQSGHNTSSNAAVNGDNYTRMTNYIASTLAAGMGIYVGQTINTQLFTNIYATLSSFFQNMLGQGMLDATYGLPFSVVCNTTNNPQARTALGYVQADVQVRYMGINEKFLVNLEGGTTVTVVQASTGATLSATASS